MICFGKLSHVAWRISRSVKWNGFRTSGR